jgi:pimeloyl-ACP methyl ester carboxylesterase
VVGVTGGEQSRRHRDRGDAVGAVVAGAVEAFVVRGGDRAQLGEHRRPSQHALGVVGVQPDALALGRREQPRLVPDRGGNPMSAEVVQQPGAPGPVEAPCCIRRHLTPAEARSSPPPPSPPLTTAPGSVSNLAVPVLVLYGDYDIFGDQTHIVRERFPRARQVTVSGSGHLHWLQQPAAYQAALLDFYPAVPR